MTLKRTYTIKFTTTNNKEYYIKDLVKYDIGYHMKYTTKSITSSSVWKNKKSIDKVTKSLNDGLFQPGFDKNVNSTYVYEVIEITPKKVSRLLKLKKILKRINQ